MSVYLDAELIQKLATRKVLTCGNISMGLTVEDILTFSGSICESLWSRNNDNWNHVCPNF